MLNRTRANPPGRMTPVICSREALF